MALSQKTFQHIQKLFVLGLPIVGSNLAMMLIGVTDIVMVGWHSVEELAALILATTLFFNIFILGSGVAFAVMPMVSSAAAVGEYYGASINPNGAVAKCDLWHLCTANFLHVGNYFPGAWPTTRTGRVCCGLYVDIGACDHSFALGERNAQLSVCDGIHQNHYVDHMRCCNFECGF